MKVFRWKGIDHKGMRVEGEFLADSVIKVRQKLGQQHITPLRITRKFQFPLSKKRSINFEDITDFSREIATLLASGISLNAALTVISDSAANANMRTITKALQKHVESGQLFSQALQSQPKYFDPIFCNLIYVGEQSGRLDSILNEIANHREKIISLKHKIKKALFYPMIVLSIALVITVGLIILVIPQFEKLFQGLGAQLPVFTRLIMGLADRIRHDGWLFLIIMIVVYLLLKMAIKKSTRVNALIEKLGLSIPLVGSTISNAIFARCFSTLATSLRAGLPLLEAMDMTAKVTGNIFYKHAFMELSQCIKAGQAINDAMKKIPIFPSRVIQMTAIGEESGHLEKMFAKLSEHFEKQVDYTVHNLSQLLEPIVMMFLCVVIGSLVIAMYLPIFLLGSVI
ncbi:MAG TPA: type II secretion system F family protein [Patescibacteria group bacterium]|nr:type II secretion system F family protein [Gammaproteobacteria bacterium]HWA51437.1 type II secretion system F family protein [Patescibacteria group bacterium]